MVSREFSTAKKVLGEFYRIETVGKFIVPFRFLTEDVVKSIIDILKSGYILSVIADSGDKNDIQEYFYSLVNSKGYLVQDILYIKRNIHNEFKKNGVPYFESMSVKNYPKYADVIDKILFSVEDSKCEHGITWSVCMELDGDCFRLKEFSNLKYHRL